MHRRWCRDSVTEKIFSTLKNFDIKIFSPVKNFFSVNDAGPFQIDDGKVCRRRIAKLQTTADTGKSLMHFFEALQGFSV